MAPTRVAVIGAGIAGPVLAIFLKRKGYDPVVYERNEDVATAGLSLMLQPNGLKVLSLLPDIVPKIPGMRLTHLRTVSELSREQISESDAPSHMAERYGEGLGMIGTRREAFLRMLCAKAEEYEIPIKWGHQLTTLEEITDTDEVEMHFANGASERTSFVVGCDGLHSNTRIALFGQEKPSFTGLVQTGGLSPTPEILKGKFAMINYFGLGAHMITYPIAGDLYSWAVTSAEGEHKETWRATDENTQEAFKSGPVSEWVLGAGALVKSTNKVVKYGLYDRPELKSWHKGRIVLLGDAAHPTTPHLGQGANQAFEDIYHLIRLLTLHHPDPSTPPTGSDLSKIFTEYESLRIPRTAGLVLGARKRGELRVIGDLERARLRDEGMRQEAAAVGKLDENALWAPFDVVAKGPYEGKSEI